ncbi:baseplate tail tube cap [Synechococcus phage S-CAM3]|uniref:Baseplate tail tube cap n=1 Tax=Synechococcus phage S-CAM3 TaxID=1883366 RepID=A0A1D8KK11_9CAUD|nr:baseplate tail tube cap [Synechococcus phage S-CAM3]AOV58986.1 baseplate tail tube cap [Synechococcus phage S-CAM3]
MDASQANASVQKAVQEAAENKKSKMTIGVTSFGKTNSSDSSAMRYPFHQSIAADSDYVTFEFYEYEPPFANEGGGTKKTNYNASVSDDILGSPKEKIILYMPEDIQSEYGANWGGAGFGLLSKGLMGGTADAFNGNFNIGNAFKEGMAAAGGATQRKTVDLVVGLANKALGTSITTNQALGGMEGKVVNPNVEMMYESPEMRGFSLNFKMFSSNDKESDEIRKICNTFKRNMLPAFGGAFIKVPNIVKVTFMTGNSPNQYVSQFKPCAVTNIAINYTPDGSWATYREGRPVATQLTLQFKELKMLFAEDITIDGASY